MDFGFLVPEHKEISDANRRVRDQRVVEPERFDLYYTIRLFRWLTIVLAIARTHGNLDIDHLILILELECHVLRAVHERSRVSLIVLHDDHDTVS